MTRWTRLANELDAWAATGRKATLWWRDDDAAAPVAALERLLSLADTSGVPLALSVIPAEAAPDLAARLAGKRGIALLQHGWAHRNRASDGARKSEFPPQLPIATAEADLRRGRQRLETLFRGTDFRLLPVLVPPWNRLHAELMRRLPYFGFEGISTYLARSGAEPVSGLRMVNTHVDVIDWRGSRGFIGREAAIALLVDHLAARRMGQVDPEEPTGLLTHHLAHDEPVWSFVAELLDRCRPHPAVQWLAAETLFAHTPVALDPARIA